MAKSSRPHPNSPAGGGGPGFFKGPKSHDIYHQSDKWYSSPRSLGPFSFLLNVYSEARSFAEKTELFVENILHKEFGSIDPAIEKLDLEGKAYQAAYELKRTHPEVTFTSGRRNRQQQAHAMATNVALPGKRHWTEKTYKDSAAKRACQKWVDDNPTATTVDQIAAGLKTVMDGFTDAELLHLSLHFGGKAFDVHPVVKDAEKIKNTIRGLTGPKNFLQKESGLVRWHAQFDF